MIERDPKFYVTGHEGEDPRKAPFYLRALVFDKKDGDLNACLVDEFNDFLREEGMFRDCCLKAEEAAKGELPERMIVINASHDDLPTSHETARIFEDFCGEKKYEIPAKVVNTREELIKELNKSPGKTLILSQCVDKNVYNVKTAGELEELGAVVVPGKITAPGSVFSDKDSTYRLLSDDRKDWSKVARYKKISTDGQDVEKVVDGILAAVNELGRRIGQNTFFVKPHEGGGGLGGFRITKTEKGYIIPDLSKVSLEASEVHPTFIDFDVLNEAKLRELLWIYRLFARSEKMTANYLQVELPILNGNVNEATGILRDYLVNSKEKRDRKLAGMVISAAEARRQLTEAIDIFEKKFNRRYIPLVNEHINFGLWGLRAHYRLSRRGPVLETMYHRIFQLAFTEEGLGYMGSDNISNKQTGELEITRLGPVNEIMLAAVGGRKSIFQTLHKGAEALVSLAALVPEGERGRVPLRLQLDLATISQRIGEGNADTARGLCLASRWPEFVRNAREWFEDSLAYYAWKKS